MRSQCASAAAKTLPLRDFGTPNGSPPVWCCRWVHTKSLYSVSRGCLVDHLRYAVTDGPDGTAAVALPTTRLAALRMKIANNHAFWCSRAVGGCGANLLVAAGEVRVPHFRHKPGERGACLLERDPAAADEPYRHLAAQRALVAWLEAQGYTAEIEFPVLGGRADVHVVIDGQSHSLEVQISPITFAQWWQRDALYRRSIGEVTWLYGDDLATRATEDLLRRDVSFHIHVESDLEVAIGTRFIDDHIAWDALDECRLTATGMCTPHSSAAMTSTQRWRALSAVAATLYRERRRREMEDQAALGHCVAPVWAGHRRPAQEAESGSGGAAYQMALMGEPAGTRPHLPSPRRYPWTREAREALAPEADGWAPPVGWDWLENLPLELRPSAQLLAYYVSCIYESGPVEQLSFDDIPDPNGHQVEALAAARLISCYEVAGVRRWRRP